jgi:hypothetical protein
MPLVDEVALVALIDSRVDAKLAAAGVAKIYFSSTSLPPDTSRRAFNTWCRSGRVEGAERDGSNWRCPAASWRAARAHGPRRVPAPPTTGTDLDADALLRAAGCRRSR